MSGRFRREALRGLPLLALSVAAGSALGGCPGETRVEEKRHEEAAATESTSASGSAERGRVQPAPTGPDVDSAPPSGEAPERNDAFVASEPEQVKRGVTGDGLHPSELAAQREIPRAPMGVPKGHSKSVLDASLAPNDPEAESVYRGRRIVDELSEDAVRLSHAYDTPEELVQDILDLVLYEDRAGIESLHVTKEEFATLCWPEFPQSRPITNIPVGDAWMFHAAHCHEGTSNLLKDWGGTELSLREIEYTEGLARYRNFNLYHGIIVHAVTDRGEPVRLTHIPSLIERNGRWKVYMYKD